MAAPPSHKAHDHSPYDVEHALQLDCRGFGQPVLRLKHHCAIVSQHDSIHLELFSASIRDAHSIAHALRLRMPCLSHERHQAFRRCMLKTGGQVPIVALKLLHLQRFSAHVHVL